MLTLVQSKKSGGSIGGLNTDFKLGSSTPVNARGSANAGQGATFTPAGGSANENGPCYGEEAINEERAKYDAELEKQV